jgi:hypothetical protein
LETGQFLVEVEDHKQSGSHVTQDVIPCQRHLFDMPRDVAYLNCAFMSPMLNAAVEAGRAAVES